MLAVQFLLFISHLLFYLCIVYYLIRSNTCTLLLLLLCCWFNTALRVMFPSFWFYVPQNIINNYRSIFTVLSDIFTTSTDHTVSIYWGNKGSLWIGRIWTDSHSILMIDWRLFEAIALWPWLSECKAHYFNALGVAVTHDFRRYRWDACIIVGGWHIEYVSDCNLTIHYLTPRYTFSIHSHPPGTVTIDNSMGTVIYFLAQVLKTWHKRVMVSSSISFFHVGCMTPE